MIPHRDTIVLIPDLVEGRVDDATARELSAHMDACPECRELADSYRAIRASVRQKRSTARAPHPGEGEIVTFAVDPHGLPEEARQRMEAHLDSCASCTREVEATRQAEGDRAAASPARHFPPRPALAAAACLLVAVLAYPAFLGLVRWPRARHDVERLSSENETLGRQLAASSGPVMLQVLESYRHGGTAAVIEIPVGQPHVLLAFTPSLPEQADKNTVYSAAIVDSSGNTSASWKLSRAAIDRSLERAGVLTLAVPTELLRPGGYEVRLLEQSATQPLLRLPFEVRPASAAPGD